MIECHCCIKMAFKTQIIYWGNLFVENKNEYNKLNLRDLMYTVFTRWYILIVLLVVCILAAVIYSNFIATPLYDSTGKLYIMNKQSENISSSDLSVSIYLTKDYEELIVDKAVLDEVSDELDNKYSYAQLKSAVTVDNPESTRFLEITVRTPDAVDSKKIVDSICEVSQEKIVELLGIDQVTIIRKGDIASSPSSPNTSGNIMKAIFFAFAAFVVIVVLICFFNDKINGPEDIEKYLEISVLGNIPYNQNKKKAKSK